MARATTFLWNLCNPIDRAILGIVVGISKPWHVWSIAGKYGDDGALQCQWFWGVVLAYYHEMKARLLYL